MFITEAFPIKGNFKDSSWRAGYNPEAESARATKSIILAFGRRVMGPIRAIADDPMNMLHINFDRRRTADHVEPKSRV